MSVHDNDGDASASPTHALAEFGDIDSVHRGSFDNEGDLKDFFEHGGSDLFPPDNMKPLRAGL
jgi:hypothetical protein